MSTSALAILGVAAAMILALLLARPVRRSGRSGGFRLRVGRPKLTPIGDSAREQYVAQWTGIQERFVDDPGAATVNANRLLHRLAVERGLPAESPGRRLRRLSVLFPRQARGARLLHRVSRQPAQDRDMESMRQALIAGRELFEALLTSGLPGDETSASPSGRTVSHHGGVPQQRATRLTHR
ncbi:hypothetical protein [Streptomyces sp. NPDC059176]|uniref:hypothetical protein n=1 Tax=unclassified Streptomyces TaxID=2593676 RepID=UPI00368BFA85